MATQPDVTSLKRKASRWQVLPPPGEEDSKDIEAVDGKYSLLLFLRDLNNNADAWNQFIEGLRNIPGALDENSTTAAILAAALETRPIQYDYIDPEAPPAKKRRLDLHGNAAAGDQLAEYDSLINLARTVWADPDNLTDFLGKAYGDNLGQLAEGDELGYTLEDIFDFARSWGEVRYRFMNHALRDDPTLHAKYNAGRFNAKGNDANAMVHDSNILLDARMVEFQSLKGTGYNTQDRVIFEELYCLTPEEGRTLYRYTEQGSGLRIGLPEVFRYCAAYINAYFGWRVRVLESARKQILSSPQYRNAGSFANKQAVHNAANRGILNALGAADNEYIAFIPTLRTLLGEAGTLNAFQRVSYDAMDAAMGRLTTAVRNSGMNRYTPDLQHNRRFQSDVAAFPRLQLSLTRPTGASIVAPPRPTQRGAPV